MASYRICAFADEADPSLEGQIRALHENRIGLLEIRGVNGINIADLAPERVREVRKTLDDAGISVWSIGSPIGKVDIKGNRAHELDRFKKVLDSAVTLGASCIRLFSFFGTNGDPAYLDEVADRLSDFVREAGPTGVIVCHENEKGIYGDTADRCLEILDRVPGLTAVFDPANFIQCGEDVLRAFRLLKDRIYYGHIKDCLKNGTVVAAGEGDGHMDVYLPELLQEKETVLTLEPHLQEFVGLSGLETPGDRTVIDQKRFASGAEAFRYATESLRALLNRAGQTEKTC
ncbi:MAG: sugar phosphate isomerase/epimerase [Clostridia bacterium]|nr:sugar phosphate isomerase/epimerase [Clostridia bacterium]